MIKCECTEVKFSAEVSSSGRVVTDDYINRRFEAASLLKCLRHESSCVTNSVSTLVSSPPPCSRGARPCSCNTKKTIGRIAGYEDRKDRRGTFYPLFLPPFLQPPSTFTSTSTLSPWVSRPICVPGPSLPRPLPLPLSLGQRRR